MYMQIAWTLLLLIFISVISRLLLHQALFSKSMKKNAKYELDIEVNDDINYGDYNPHS